MRKNCKISRMQRHGHWHGPTMDNALAFPSYNVKATQVLNAHTTDSEVTLITRVHIAFGMVRTK